MCQTGLRLHPDELAQLQRLADRRGQSRGETLRQGIRVLQEVQDLVDRAHRIGGGGMTVYVTDLEVALELRAPGDVPTKTGMNDGKSD